MHEIHLDKKEKYNLTCLKKADIRVQYHDANVEN